MTRHGIDRACVCSARGIWYDDEEGNRETEEMVAAHPRLIPVATLDPRKYINAVAEIKRCADQGIRIFRLFPEYQGWSIDSPSARRILGMLDDARVVIMIGGTMTPILPELEKLHSPVILAGAHFYQLADALACADGMANLYLSTRLLIGPGSIEKAVSILGPQRLVFGSHAPLIYLDSALRVFEAANLSAAQREPILYGNFWKLIGGADGRH